MNQPTTQPTAGAATHRPQRLRLQGIVPPVATPMLPDGTLDLPSLERLCEHLLSSGVHGLFPLGSTGEVAYLTDQQRFQVVATVADVTAGRVPVLAGAIDLTAARVVERSLQLVDAGADAVVVTAPLYALNDRQEVADHFRMIAAALPVPVVAYDVPVRVHSKLPADLLVELGSEGTVVAVKDSSGDDVGFRRLIALNAAAGQPLQLLSGHEVVVDAMALIGADGAVPGLANVDAAGYVRLWEAARRGDWDTARTEQERLNALFEIVFAGAGHSPDAAGVGAFKAAMAARGLIDHSRLADPVRPLGEAAVQRVGAVLRALDAG